MPEHVPKVKFVELLEPPVLELIEYGDSMTDARLAREIVMKLLELHPEIKEALKEKVT